MHRPATDIPQLGPAWILAAMLALVPLATGNLTGLGIGAGPLLYDNIALPRLVIALVLTFAGWAAWSAYAARDGEELKGDTVLALLGALVIWAALSAALSPHRALAVLGQSERLEGVVTVVLYVLLYGLALQAVRRVTDVRRIASALAGAAVLLSAYALVQFAGIEPFDYTLEGYDFVGRRGFATFGNPNFLAGLLVLAFPLAGALSLTAKRRASQVVWAMGTVMIMSATFITLTRGAWIAAALQVALGLFVWRRGRVDLHRPGARVLLVAGVLAAVLLLSVSLTAEGDANVVRRVSDAFKQAGSAHERAVLLSIAGEAAKERPVAGYGPDAFLPAFRMHRSDEYVSSFSAFGTLNHAHSWPLQYAATLGFPGMLLLASAIALALWRARGLLSMSADGRGGILMAGVWVACLGFAVNMLMGVVVLGATVPFWVMLGTLGAVGVRRIQVPAMVLRVGTAAATLGFLLAIAASGTLLTADASYLASRNAFHGLAPGDPVALAERARTLNPTSVKYARGAAEARSALVSDAIFAEQPAETVRSLYGDALAEFEWLLRQSPNDYPGLARLAALHARTGVYLDDQALIEHAQATARRATLLDRQSEAVMPLATGDMSETAISRAARVLPLP